MHGLRAKPRVALEKSRPGGTPGCAGSGGRGFERGRRGAEATRCPPSPWVGRQRLRGTVPAPPWENGEREPDQQVGGKQVERAVLAPGLI